MRRLRRTETPTSPGPEASGAQAVGKPGSETYLAARAEWNERYGSYISQARTWRLAALLSMLVSLGAVGGVVYIGSQSKIVPYIVEVNQLGDALAAQRADVASTPDTRLIRAQLARWIVDVRTVYLDAAAQHAIVNEAYGMTDRQSPADGALNDYFRAHNPFIRAQDQSVTVHVSSVLPISENTWRIEWREETFKRDGSASGTANWRATVSVAINPPTDSNTILINPTGLYVQQFGWGQAQ